MRVLSMVIALTFVTLLLTEGTCANPQNEEGSGFSIFRMVRCLFTGPSNSDDEGSTTEAPDQTGREGGSEFPEFPFGGDNTPEATTESDANKFAVPSTSSESEGKLL